MTEYDKLRQYYLEKIKSQEQKILVLAFDFIDNKTTKENLAESIYQYRDIVDHIKTIDVQEACELKCYSCDNCLFYKKLHLCEKNAVPCTNFILYNNDKGEL